ncbi:hypothetical protein CDAR_264401 [Caerostris darwini]|uniref:Uncharacterized protein n=1 Tax=Caerostris darwini TaxID=1538125 RepID=A0AAV4Q4L6_9ARAC|nr:hypothetical protein CDAR_264401 [Caerostris darwini]
MISIPKPPPPFLQQTPLMPGRENPIVCRGDRRFESVVANNTPPLSNNSDKTQKILLFENAFSMQNPPPPPTTTLSPMILLMDVETSDPTQLTHCNMSDDFHPKPPPPYLRQTPSSARP